MIKRNKTKTVSIGSVKIGSGHPIAIQSMTKVFTTDVDRCVRQVQKLLDSGCGLVRIAVPTAADTAALAKIIAKVNAPIIADIHFSAQRAVEAIEAGAAKIRLNPGNIKERSDINRIIDAAKAHKIAIRIGVNEASIRDLKSDTAPVKRTALMLKEMKKYIRIFESRGFDQIVLSAKSSNPLRTIEVNRAISQTFDYPIHVGLTHAGLPEDAAVPSAVSLGTLLAEGIGDTIRVSAAGDPVIEVKIAQQILTSLGLLARNEPELIVCPTCGRAQLDVAKLARKIKKAISDIDAAPSLRIAVMGCVVNGPGEAADADIAVCAGKDKAFLYVAGKKLTQLSPDSIVPAVIAEIKKKMRNR